jgi:hypothetical protein
MITIPEIFDTYDSTLPDHHFARSDNVERTVRRMTDAGNADTRKLPKLVRVVVFIELASFSSFASA